MKTSNFKIGDKITHKEYGGEYVITGWNEKRQNWECYRPGNWFTDEFKEKDIIHI